MGTLIYPLGWTRDRHGNRSFAVPRQLEGSIPLLELAKLNPGIPTYCVVVDDCTTELQLDQNCADQGETASSFKAWLLVSICAIQDLRVLGSEG